MSLSKGDVVDRYIIDGPLGSGGMGEVYRARDTRLQRNVALKILRLDLSPQSLDSNERTGPTDGAARMLREARAAAALDHPNVVAIFDVGQILDEGPLKGTTYLAMELIKGRPLRAFVGDASVPVRQRLRWLVEVAKALGAAHEAGLVHRDVKPDNVMVRNDGAVKVLDFGIARRARNAPINPTGWTEQVATATATQAGVIVGTPLYIAPEQLRGDPLDGRADQFSWAVMAYELLTGKPPWRMDDGPVALLSQILTARPPPLDGFDEIPPHAKTTLLRALEKDRELRFASMADVVAALEGDADPFAPTASKIATGRTVISSRSGGADASSVSAPTERAEISAREPPPPPPAAVETNRATSHTRPSPVPPAPGRSRTLVIGSIALIAAGAIAGGLAWRSRATSGRAPAASAIAAPVAGCTSNRACVDAHGGEAWVCRASDKQCAAIASQDCTAKYEPRDLEHDDTVWIGAMFPLKGPLVSFGQMNANGVDLARREVSEATRSLGDEGSAQHVRRLGIVLCDDSDDPMRAAKHLVDDVGVPAIVGFKSGQEIVDVAGSLLIKRQILTVATLTSNPLITKLPQPSGLPRMVWRTTLGYDALADATAAFIEGTLAPHAARGNTQARIVLVRLAKGAESAFADRLFDKVVFNGKRAVENGGAYQEIVLPIGDATDERLGPVVAKIVREAPSIVVMVIDEPSANALAEAVDKQWATPKRPLPFFVAANSSTSVFDEYIGTDAARRRRVFAIDSVSSTGENAHFVFRYNGAYEPAVSRWANPASSYDAFYMLAYASVALGSGPLDGAALARAIPRLLPPGVPTEVGPNGVLQAVSALTSGASIDLRGAASALDFNVATGEASVDLALLCPDVDGAGQAAGDIESGLVYRSATGRVDGQLKCR